MLSLAKIFNPLGKAGTMNPETGEMHTTPWVARTEDGIYIGLNDEVWLYWLLPSVPFQWEDPDAQTAIGGPLHEILIDIGATSRRPAAGLKFTGENREVHIVAIQWEELPKPPAGTSDKLAQYLNDTLTFLTGRKACFIGVKLRKGGTAASTGADGLYKMLQRLARQSMQAGHPDLADYRRDRTRMQAILARNGCRRPTLHENRMLEAWYNQGKGTDAVLIAEPSGRKLSTNAWPNGLEMAAVVEFERLILQAPKDSWANDAATHNEGAIVISIRGELTPSDVARTKFRGAQRKAKAQWDEQNKTGDLERKEDADVFHMGKAIEDYFADGSEPLLSDASIIFARVATDTEDSYQDLLRSKYGIIAKTLEMRQIEALDETLPCSTRRLGRIKPFGQALSVPMIAYSGISAFSQLGDDKGLYLGLSLPDFSPVYVDPLASATRDQPPGMVVVGEPGSGKLLRYTEMLPTPSGYVTMGDVRVGDTVLGRDGKPCTVMFKSPVNETPELYDIRFSDGQVITACVDHQWVVSSRRSRLAPVRPGRLAAVDRFDRLQRLGLILNRLESESVPGVRVTAQELFARLELEAPGQWPWSNHKSVRTALSFVGCPSSTEYRDTSMQFSVPELVKSDPVVLWPVAEFLNVAIDRWGSVAGGNRTRWGSQIDARVAAAKAWLGEIDETVEMHAQGIRRELEARGGPVSRDLVKRMAAWAREAGVECRAGRAEVRVPLPSDAVGASMPMSVYEAGLAYKALAVRLGQIVDIRPSLDVEETVMTVGEMIEEGVILPGGRRNFAVRITEPLDLPPADLPVEPYLLGVWLGDGTTGAGSITQGASEPCRNPDSGETDLHHMFFSFEFEGYQPRVGADRKTIGTVGFAADLRNAGVLNRKHIPMVYKRASYGQRLAVVQGLMDTDGTIDANGYCELCLCDKTLFDDAVEMIRSLGIKVGTSEGPASITEEDPDQPGATRRRVTGTRWRAHFTTDRPVFRLTRKAVRLPEPGSLRSTNNLLYIESITPAPTEPGACISVDSSDSTYLVGSGYVPTKNTFAGLSLAFQSTLQGQTTIFINPKAASSLRDFAEAAGGNVISLRDLEAEGGGALDPFRYCSDPQIASEILNGHILGCLVDFTEAQRVELISGIQTGAAHGARCAWEALQYVADKSVVQMIGQLASGSTLFALGIGARPREPLGLGSRGKFTLIEFDRPLSLPTATAKMRDYDHDTRMAVATMRLVTRASLEILLNTKGGTLLVDEAWVFLSSAEGAAALTQLGREGRSQAILPILMTQKIDDVLRDGVDLESFISRVLVLKTRDRKEATAGLSLVGLDPTQERLQWLSRAGAIRATEDHPGRAALGFLRDMEGRHCAVMIGPVPDYLHMMMSTNRLDVERRARAKQQAGVLSARPVSQQGPHGG